MKYRTILRNFLLFGMTLALVGCGGNDSTTSDNGLKPEHSLEDFSEDTSDDVTKEASTLQTYGICGF